MIERIEQLPPDLLHLFIFSCAASIASPFFVWAVICWVLEDLRDARKYRERCAEYEQELIEWEAAGCHDLPPCPPPKRVSE
jgi:hypothetical protein